LNTIPLPSLEWGSSEEEDTTRSICYGDIVAIKAFVPSLDQDDMNANCYASIEGPFSQSIRVKALGVYRKLHLMIIPPADYACHDTIRYLIEMKGVNPNDIDKNFSEFEGEINQNKV
jgi:hypothetical protein